MKSKRERNNQEFQRAHVAESMVAVPNCPSRTIRHDRWTIEGYSRAAVQTYWRVPEMKIGFDVGAHPWDYMSLPNLFITHTHLDHVAALAVFVARRRMMKMEPPRIYVPESAVSTIETLLRIFSRLDRGRLPCEIIGLSHGQEVEVSRELVVTATSMRHSVVALGYVIWERRRKLKSEFQNLEGTQIRDLKLSGVEVTYETRLPLIAYTGDTQPEGLDACPAMFDAEILISETTFVAPSHRKEKIHKHGHTHLDDIVARRDRFKNRVIILSHFSTRYSDAQIVHWVDKAIPDRLDGRLNLWL